ncbi:MAG: hypothetical protein V2I40_07065 [Desulfobacteraceae bacterium]|nr:hypothetical protein [Desulfobacteraceae bacterium]
MPDRNTYKPAFPKGSYIVDWVERFRLFVFFFADAFVEKIYVFGHPRFDDHRYAKVESLVVKRNP